MGTNPQNESPLQYVMDALHDPPFNVNLVAGPFLVRYRAEYSVEVHGVMFCATLRTVAHHVFGVDTDNTELRLMPGNDVLLQGYTLLSSSSLDAQGAVTLTEAGVLDGALIQLFG